MNHNIPEVSKKALDSFRKFSPDIIKKVVDLSMLRKDEISQHGDKAYQILTAGIDMTTKMLDNAMSVHEPELLAEQLKWAKVRLPVDNVKPEHIYSRFKIYIDVINQILPADYASEVNNFVNWMLVRQKEIMDIKDD